MMLKRVLEEKGVLGWLNLGLVINFDVTVVELPDCIALCTYLTAVRSPDCIKQRYVIMTNWEGRGIYRLWPTLKYHSAVCVEGLRKIVTNLNKCPNRGSNLALSAYKSAM